MESFLSVKECAALLHVSEATVYRQCKNGKIKHRREGSAIRIYANQFKPELTSDEENAKLKDYIFGDSPMPVSMSKEFNDFCAALQSVADGATKALQLIQGYG